MLSGWAGPAIVAIGFMVFGFYAHAIFIKLRDAAAHRSAQDIVRNAKRDAEVLLKEAQLSVRDESAKLKEKAEEEMTERRRELAALEDRLTQREDLLEQQNRHILEKEQRINRKADEIDQNHQEAARQKKQLGDLLDQARQKLESIGELTAEAARERLLEQIKNELSVEAAGLIRKSLEDATETAEQKARDIITQAIQRYAADQTADVTTIPVILPNEDMKGRIIGREGRNIRAIEMATGVNVIIDDSPGVIILSSFDPIRREIAKISLERLIEDGRINPTLIEEMIDKVTADLDNIILKEGEDAIHALGLGRVPLSIMQHLGRLKFRHSFSQNVLQHSIETAHLMGIMAAELGLDEDTAKRIGLFHDIGKATSHETSGNHAEIGATLLRQAGEPAIVVEAVQAHHRDTPTARDNIYTELLIAADAITASRPGARAELTQLYLKRMTDLEAIAGRNPGVVRSFAMQAGREIRVFVEPEQIDDNAAIELARNITRDIEKQIEYAGQIKVTVIRETRFVEYAR